jgi:hypothetical protein
MMTIIPGLTSRARLNTSIPVMSGSLRSSNRRSKSASVKASIAPVPVDAVPVTKPASSKAADNTTCILISSSTISTRPAGPVDPFAMPVSTAVTPI